MEVRAATATATTTATTTLIVDMREGSLHTALTIPHEMKQLHVGDIHIGLSNKGNGPALMLERKTWTDFQASLLDGRYREQRGRLLAAAAELGARVAYILEGNPSSLRPPFTEASIMKVVARLQFKHGVPVFRTASVAGTADLVQMLHAQWMEERTSFETEGVAQRAADGIHVVKRHNTEDPSVFGTSMLCLVHGVSVKIAEAWLAAFGSCGAVISADVKALADVKVGTRRVGDAVANRAVTMWTSIGIRGA